jgi:hypothetical protein
MDHGNRLTSLRDFLGIEFSVSTESFSSLRHTMLDRAETFKQKNGHSIQCLVSVKKSLSFIKYDDSIAQSPSDIDRLFAIGFVHDLLFLLWEFPLHEEKLTSSTSDTTAASTSPAALTMNGNCKYHDDQKHTKNYAHCVSLK